MRYASLCSGIEAATVAWKPLGWSCAWLSEIERFPCAVLAHHYPDTSNLGDMTLINKDAIHDHGTIDLLVGGTPCQSFSVAGLRKGLADPRGNLALEFLRLVDATRPRWVVWENVPGVLSSNGGRDFGAFIGGLVQLGYQWAYRILDAQYFGVPQRRRRVFVVGHLGDWRRAASVLFERQSLSGHPPPSREAGPGVAGGVAACLNSGGNNGGFRTEPVEHLVVMAHGQASAEIVRDGSPSLSCNHEAPIIAHTLRGEGFDAGEDGTGWGTPIVPVAFDTKGTDAQPGQVSPTLRSMNHNGSHANAGGQVGVAAVTETLYNKGITHGDCHASTQETDTTTLLRSLREEVGEETIAEWGLGILVSFLSPEILQPAVYGFSLRCPTIKEFGLVHYALSRPKAGSERAVRILREIASHRCTSFRWEPHEQRSIQLASYLSKLSHPPTSAETILRDLWRSSQGPGVLRQALSAIQEARKSASCQAKPAHPNIAARRLVPVECEYLQGFPRNYTRIPYRNKPADKCPDGPRYKAIGNSMAVPVMRWIGEHIEMVELLNMEDAK